MQSHTPFPHMREDTVAEEEIYTTQTSIIRAAKLWR